MNKMNSEFAVRRDFPVEGVTGDVIQKAIDAAFAAGGGRVVVKAGEYRSGSLRLRSHVELHLEKGVTIIGGAKSEDYFDFPVDVCAVRPENSAKVFLYAWDSEDISITGDGVIEGQGPEFFDRSNMGFGGSHWAKPPYPRPRMVQFVRCRNIRLEGVTFKDSPGWTMLIRLCTDVSVENIRVLADQRIINSDGIDFDGCRHVRVRRSYFKTGDDCLIVRAMREAGLNDHIICEDVVFEDCDLDSTCQIIRMGCPSDDVIRNIRIRNIRGRGLNGINFDYPARYLRPDDEGYMDISDVVIENLTGEFYGMALRMVVEPGVKLRNISDIRFRDVNVKSRWPVEFVGNADSPLKKIVFENVSVSTPDGENAWKAVATEPLVFRNCTFNGKHEDDRDLFTPRGERQPLVRSAVSWETKSQKKTGPERTLARVVPLVDISEDSFRQTIVAEGAVDRYEGHPTTLLADDGRTIFCVWTTGHGGPCGQMARSDDGGLTWTRLDGILPDVYRNTHKNCPTLQKAKGPDGVTRYLVFSQKHDENGVYLGMGILVSEDLGKTWHESPWQPQLQSYMPPTGFIPLKDGRYALFGQVRKVDRGTDGPQDDQNIWMATSSDGGLSWSDMKIVAAADERNLCEPCCVRSPDGTTLALIIRENRHVGRAMMCFSKDEGETWSTPVDTSDALTGDRHEAIMLPDGRYLIAFRNQTIDDPLRGQYMAWVGTWDDLVSGEERGYRVHLLHHHAPPTGWNGDTGYSGVELLADGTIVCTTYTRHFADNRQSSVVSARFKISDVDCLVSAQNIQHHVPLVFHIDCNTVQWNRPALISLLREVADLGYNAILWEVEDKVKWDTPEVASPDAFTKSQFREILAEADRLGLEPIPLFQSFGHGEYVLKKKAYLGLRENLDEPDCYCVSKPETFAFQKRMLEEYLDLFGPKVKRFHLGSDEAYGFAKCPVCSKRDKMELFCEHLGRLAAILEARGIKPGIWHDMVVGGMWWQKKDENYDAAKVPNKYTVWYADYKCDNFRGEKPVAIEKLRDLKRRGFEVILSGSAASYGDGPFLPQFKQHRENLMECARAARDEKLDGLAVTSWSIRQNLRAMQKPLFRFAAKRWLDPSANAADDWQAALSAEGVELSPDELDAATVWGDYAVWDGRGCSRYKEGLIPDPAKLPQLIAKHRDEFRNGVFASPSREPIRKGMLSKRDVWREAFTLQSKTLDLIDEVFDDQKPSVDFTEAARHLEREQSKVSAEHSAAIIWGYFAESANRDFPMEYCGIVEPLPGEKWWGGTTFFGSDQPYSTTECRDLEKCSYCNPCAPLFVSNKGRYIWSDEPFAYWFTDGVMHIESHVPVTPVQAGTTLKEAYLAAVRKHVKLSGELPDESFFTKPQFNTYVECVVKGGMDEKNVGEYVDGLIASGIPCGVLMLDDGWTDCKNYGDLAFSETRFPHARDLLEKIHAAGMKTLLWTTPYFAYTSKEYTSLDAKGWFLKNSLSGETHPATYYPGLPRFGMLDVFDESKWDAIEERYKTFCREMGFDGYKFDFTDADCVYRVPDPSVKGDPLPKGKKACDYTEAWGRFTSRFKFNELRAGYKYGGLPLVVRLQDKAHSWEELRMLVPDMLAAGLLGCAYTCPDMIGGGAAGTFKDAENGGTLDHKLFVRSCQTQALMPMMQFSAAPWRVLSKEELDICREMGKLHERFSPYILECARHASETGEPIVRTMEYAFPGQGFDRCLQQYMLGDDYLVAPVVCEDDSVTVGLPEGKWVDDRGEIHVGPKTLKLKQVPLARLPYFKREKF